MMLSPLRSSSPELPIQKENCKSEKSFNMFSPTQQKCDLESRDEDEDDGIRLISESEFICAGDIPSEIFSADDVTSELQDHSELFYDVTDFHVNTPCSGRFSKYEEYEMRPIKPLDSALQLEMYGSPVTSSHHDKPKSRRPQPLKKHSGMTSKHDVTRARNSGDNSVASPLSASKMMKKNSLKLAHQTSTQIEKKNFLKKGSGLNKFSRIMSPSAQPIKVMTSSSRELSKKFPAGNKANEKAATKIQALWRGFCARNKNEVVISLKREIRARRADQYISILCDEIVTMKETLKMEKQLRQMQVEAIKCLWKKVEDLEKKGGG